MLFTSNDWTHLLMRILKLMWVMQIEEVSDAYSFFAKMTGATWMD
jgi:hypothetical protein